MCAVKKAFKSGLKDFNILKLVFTNTQDSPSKPPQLSRYPFVTSDVPIDFVIPVCLIGIWATVAFCASMPEATIHKHYGFHMGKNEIGFPG